MVTASRRKLRMLLPNLRSASSAASSAFSTSLRRFAASERKRDSMPSASFTMSAVRDSGRSGWASVSSVAFSVDASWEVEADLELEASPGWREILRAWLMMLETLAEAFLTCGAYCLLALS